MIGTYRDGWVSSRDFPSAPFVVSGHAARNRLNQAINSLPPSFLRADSDVVLDATDLAWRAWTRGRAQSAQLRADAQVDAARAFAHLGGLGRRRNGLRSDSTSYYALDLVDRSAPIVRRPVQPASLLAAIPIRNVDLSANSYELRFMDVSAGVETWTSGKTTTPLATLSTDSSLRPMHVFHTGYAGGDWRSRQMASRNPFNEDAEKASACQEALETFLTRTWLTSGAPGLDSLHLGNLPVQRSTSTNVYGTTAADTVLPEFSGYLQAFEEIFRGAGRGGSKRCLITSRILHSLSRYSNFAAGGDGLLGVQEVLEYITSQGFAVEIVDDLYGFGGTTAAGAPIDGMVLYVDYSHGLKHLLSLRPAPVDTYQVGSSQVTEMATISGGLICEDRQSCMIVEIPVTPAPGT